MHESRPARVKRTSKSNKGQTRRTRQASYEATASACPVDVRIDLRRIAAAARDIKRKTGRLLIAVVKSDAYGLGASQVAKALSGIADEFAYFSLAEARSVRAPGLILGPLSGSADEHAAIGVRPAVASLAEARRLGRTPAVLNVDTGMQWLGAPPDQIDAICRTCRIVEAFTHTVTVKGALRLKNLCDGKAPRLHAAATALLGHPAAYLDAVRPGLALYRGAVHVTTRLTVVRDLDGPAGYRRFNASRAGVILCGYAQGFAPGVVTVNGCRRRVLEVGMNTAMIEVGPSDRAGDRVVLLGPGFSETDAAEALGCSPHQVLCRYTRLGTRRYVTGA